MQKIATRVFIWASVVFGVLGVIHILTVPTDDAKSSDFSEIIMRLLIACGFIVLSSFALSVAGKYLSSK